MSTTRTGRDAEESVAELLAKNKHTIHTKNWRTQWCEIDIVSSHKKIVYFTEVKYRSSSAWGDGLDYITPKKLQQMHFAAELWLSTHNWKGDAQLQVAAVDEEGMITLIEIDGS